MNWNYVKQAVKYTAIGHLMGGAIALAIFAPLMAEGATITVTPDAVASGLTLGLTTRMFERIGGPCGSGSSVVGDGCSVVQKNDPAAPHAYGRFDPLGGSWIDSQDIAELRMTIVNDVKFTSASFAMTDMVDQPDTHMVVTTSEGGQWEAPGRIGNGGLYWFTFDLVEAVNSLEVFISTRHNDGYGISSLSVAPVPIPAGLWLLLAGATTIVTASFWPRAVR